MGGADKELINKLLKNPNFYKSKLEKSKFDKLSKKKALKEYYCKLTNKKYKESSIFSQLKKPDRYFYNGILAFIIAGKRGMIISEEFPYNNGASLTEIISGMKNPVYEYNIPDGEVAEGFIQYAENLSTQIHGKNIFKFNVIKEEN